MKKLFIVFIVMIVFLSGCSGNKEDNQEEEIVNKIPEGIYLVQYFGNSSGEYVEEVNFTEDFYGRPIEILPWLAEDYGETAYFDIDEEGKGTFYDFTKVFSVTFDEEKFVTDEGNEFTYTMNGNTFWFEETPGSDMYFIMKKVSMDEVNLVLSGCWGTKPISEAEIGDLVVLGTYDTAPGNDKTEPLRWKIIDKDGDNILIIVNDLIDSFSYNYNPDKSNLDSVTWENSSLRAFLNDSEGFLSIFSKEELGRMQITHNENKAQNDLLNDIWKNLEDKGNAAYSDLRKQNRSDDPDTDDKVFLLSVDEVLKYFGDVVEKDPDESDDNYPFSVINIYPNAIARVTKSVDDLGQGYYDKSTLGGAWMTRTLSSAHPGDGAMVTYVSGSGHIFNYFTYTPMFIRPAVWINTK